MDHLSSPASDIGTVIAWAWTTIDQSAEDVAEMCRTTPAQALCIKKIVIDLLFELTCGPRQ